ncbi:FAD/NAD(P)-binding oxidoreductase [Caballeronia sp. LZ032]|uniref:NAD(P)/FAD-dependent oxidoreductase n=1 Tax=Caballeronia sp. LZ032 TaxID=3038565 RepID=UPI002854A16D|nr:FAD/NAD(P)-binding oxidoreductase [Caballeronia sp. LZ032]MDR5880470.1 FAD/NAD(P)-binding oxidoreductase [Caballeronia sp. LZ032]
MTVSVRSFDVVVVGGGAGGMSVAARLRRMDTALRIAVIEPSEYHYYQPAWTLVGGGQYDIARTRRSTRTCLPHGVELVAGRVCGFVPEANSLVVDGGTTFSYRCLVVAAGIELNWEAIQGLSQTLGKNGVTSNYRYDLAPYTWQCIESFSGGRALFTQPPMPIKCAGAPQKILYLAADYFRRKRVSADVRFFTPGPSMFGVPFYAKALARVMQEYDATACFGHRLVKVDGEAKLAYFEVEADGNKSIQIEQFDMLHVVPPQRAPQFIRESALADSAGWLDVDKETMRHVRFANVFGIGDCTSTPNSKTAAAVKNQVPVVATNALAMLKQTGESMRYDGYASCPLTTSAGKVMLAEFCYDGVVTPSFPADPRRPRKFYWWLKQRFLPFLYWNIVIRGRHWPITHRRREFPEALPPIVP